MTFNVRISAHSSNEIVRQFAQWRYGYVSARKKSLLNHGDIAARGNWHGHCKVAANSRKAVD
jgi:hypothetical protein